MDLYHHSGNMVFYCAYVLFCLPLIFRSRVLCVVTGSILSLVFAYLLLALSSDLLHFLDGSKPVHTAAVYFGVGFLSCGSLLFVLVA